MIRLFSWVCCMLEKIDISCEIDEKKTGARATSLSFYIYCKTPDGITALRPTE